MLRYITCYVVLCLCYFIEHVPFMSCCITCYVTLYNMLSYAKLYNIFVVLCLCYVIEHVMFMLCYITCNIYVI